MTEAQRGQERRAHARRCSTWMRAQAQRISHRDSGALLCAQRGRWRWRAVQHVSRCMFTRSVRHDMLVNRADRDLPEVLLCRRELKITTEVKTRSFVTLLSSTQARTAVCSPYHYVDAMLVVQIASSHDQPALAQPAPQPLPPP